MSRIQILLWLLYGFLLFLLFLIGIQLANAVRIQNYLSQTLRTPLPKAPRLDSFRITNPYDAPGEYRKAQLHLHTSRSRDVREKIPVGDTIRKYQAAGYQFVAITDHDLITTCPELNSSNFLCLPGMEITIPYIFWPLGRHMAVINIRQGPGSAGQKISWKKLQRGELFSGSFIIPAHPNWRGNLGTGFWFLMDIFKLSGCRMIEISNHHSDSGLDVLLWHKLLALRGDEHPVWGVAVDDTDNGQPLDRGWIMVKTDAVTEASLMTSLKNGAFYATTGPSAYFQVDGGTITAHTTPASQISFIDGQNKEVASLQGESATYRPLGDEGFIRVEIQDANGRKAWSQPFFLIPGESPAK